MPRLIQIEDGDVGLLPRRQRADLRQPQHARASRRRPVHDVFCGYGIGTFDGPMGMPTAVHLADHVGGFVGGRTVDAKRNRAAKACHRVRRSDAGAEPAVGLRAVRHTGSGVSENPDFVGIEVNEMREPHIRSKPIVVGQPFDRPLAVDR